MESSKDFFTIKLFSDFGRVQQPGLLQHNVFHPLILWQLGVKAEHVIQELNEEVVDPGPSLLGGFLGDSMMRFSAKKRDFHLEDHFSCQSNDYFEVVFEAAVSAGNEVLLALVNDIKQLLGSFLVIPIAEQKADQLQFLLVKDHVFHLACLVAFILSELV